MDVLTLLIMAAFYLLFFVSIARYLRNRHPLELAVVLVFTSTAAIFAIAALNLVAPAVGSALGPVAVSMLVAQPALMLRLVGSIVPLPRWTAPVVVAGFVIAVGGFYATDRSTPAVLFLVGYFFAAEFLAAALLVAEGRRRVGFPRVRLTTAGFASLLFGLSILISGLASAARGGAGPADPAITLISRLLALVAGLGYLAAFVPPRWLREIGYRSLAFDVVRSIVSRPTGTDERVLWRALADAAGQILGSPRVRIVATGEAAEILSASEPGSGPDPAWRPDDVGYSVKVPIHAEGGHVADLEARLPGRPLFLEDDVALIDLLGSLTARAVERERAMATLADAERAVIETTAVRASEARFRALLDAEPNAMLSVDGAGLVVWCTRSAERMFGAESSHLVGRPLESLVAPANEARRPGAASSGALRYETSGTRDDGSTFPAEVALSNLEFDGEPATLAVVTDISWRDQAEELRDRFIGVLSHELRTPITSIFGGAQVLLRRGSSLDPTTRDDLLTQVAGEAERLERMVENLLILARVERGADVVDVSPVLLHRIVPAVVARERGTWPSMDLVVEPLPHLPPVAGDEASIALVLRNLISNAGKYAGPEAVVRVSISADPEGPVSVQVRDDGPGIDPAEADSLFGLYFRSSSSAAAPGSGIGLFVCRELVGAMGGSSWARPGPEGGAEFGFDLPLYVDIADVDTGTIPAPATTIRDGRAPIRHTTTDGAGSLVPGATPTS
jgi:PAS domain S-box-containing protein